MADDRIERTEALGDVIIMARRLAWLHHAFSSVLEEELGSDRARELVLKAIREYGNRAGRAARRHVEELGLDPTPQNLKLAPDLPRLGWETAAEETPDGRGATVITYCPLAEAWAELGAERIGRLYCYVDQGKVEGYNPGLTCRHARNVLDGDAVCEIVIEKGDA